MLVYMDRDGWRWGTLGPNVSVQSEGIYALIARKRSTIQKKTITRAKYGDPNRDLIASETVWRSLFVCMILLSIGSISLNCRHPGSCPGGNRGLKMSTIGIGSDPTRVSSSVVGRGTYVFYVHASVTRSDTKLGSFYFLDIGVGVGGCWWGAGCYWRAWPGASLIFYWCNRKTRWTLDVGSCHAN